MENLDKIKLAVEVELKHKYIDIHGKSQTFSSFIRKEALKEYKLLKKNPKWAVLAEVFEYYPLSSLNERRLTIEHIIRIIRSEVNQAKTNTKKSEVNKYKSPKDMDVTYIKGVGPKIAYKLNKLGIYTAYDLIMYLPKRHIDYSSRTLIKNLKENEETTVFGYIKTVSSFKTRNNLSVTKVKVEDESGSIILSFFNAKSNRYLNERMKSQFPQNAGIMLSGKVKRNSFDNKLTFDKPSYSIMTGEFLENSSSNLNLGRIVPIYTVCSNLSIKVLRRAIYNALGIFKDKIENVLPDFIMRKYGILDKSYSIQQVHFPESLEILNQARFSLIFEELFIVQLKLLRIRAESLSHHDALALKVKTDGLVRKFIRNLPFELTSAQKNAVNEILNDLNSDIPMARLLQGDVGSGKTVVATIMLLAGVENGYQGAIMAPTEIF